MNDKCQKSQMLFLSQNVKPLDCRISLRNWVFATNWHFLTPIASQPDGVNLWFFKLRISDLIELKVRYIKGPGEWVTKL